ncbi:MAG: DUF5946 family protein [Allosphingosinicella sp.]|uniref:DUF5946 family protein n=1 Tax=Allosphingosinicella sp. TaxID=2823234 RepID=UPI003945C2E8
MERSGLEICPGCDATLPPVVGSAHPYIGSSPSCWAAYGDLLAREYGDAELMKVHRLTVDAYAAQHPGVPGRRSTQSVWVHLGGLYLTLERGLSGDFARRVIGRMTDDAERLVWLEPPVHRGTFRVTDILAAEGPGAHEAAVLRWSEEVWRSWAPHHRTIIDAANRAVAKFQRSGDQRGA